MAYRSIKNSNSSINNQQGWQLRVHIDPFVLDVANGQNKIEVIRNCLLQVFGQDEVEIKCYSFANQSDRDQYDAAMSSSGKDRTQVGKEVCIYLPDSGISQLNSTQYKAKLLKLWKLLLDNGVPLLHFNVPGDQSIMISGDQIPSPFSFTSQNPNRDEWKDKHGILFKKFEPHGQHPILSVNFSIDDINSHEIALNDSLDRSCEFLAAHSLGVQPIIDEHIKSVDDKVSFQEFLMNDKKTKMVLKSLLAGYEKGMADCTDAKQRGLFQVYFPQILEANADYQRLIREYPHENDKDFRDDPLIGEIRTKINGRFDENRIDEIVDQLRKQYASKIKEIETDFKENNIHYPQYDMNMLINKDPAKMQCIFRQIALIKQENEQNSLVCSGPIALKVTLLQSYKKEREHKTNSQYFNVFGFFSRVFGAWSKDEKFAAVDALIDALKTQASPYHLDEVHLGPLQQGTLGKIIDQFDLKFVKVNHQEGIRRTS
jgi:hypothetical protein